VSAAGGRVSAAAGARRPLAESEFFDKGRRQEVATRCRLPFRSEVGFVTSQDVVEPAFLACGLFGVEESEHRAVSWRALAFVKFSFAKAPNYLYLVRQSKEYNECD